MPVMSKHHGVGIAPTIPALGRLRVSQPGATRCSTALYSSSRQLISEFTGAVNKTMHASPHSGGMGCEQSHSAAQPSRPSVASVAGLEAHLRNFSPPGAAYSLRLCHHDLRFLAPTGSGGRCAPGMRNGTSVPLGRRSLRRAFDRPRSSWWRPLLMLSQLRSGSKVEPSGGFVYSMISNIQRCLRAAPAVTPPCHVLYSSSLSGA
jgi:hypothetical protein